MWGRDFVAGWVTPDRNDFFLEIAFEDGEVATHGLFAPRGDAVSRSGAKAFAFVCPFDRVLRDGEQVSVALDDGGVLAGSPLVCRSPAHDGTPAPVRVHVERPDGAIFRPLETIAGWAVLGGGANDLTFLVAGIEQEVRFHARPDVAKHFDTPFALGWEFTCDVAAASHASAPTLRVLSNGRSVFERSFAAHIAPRDDALVLFMHIPKTAGTSLVTAIERQPRLDSHWLYPTHRAPVEQRIARLSTGALADLDILGGHFFYGLHSEIARRCVYIAILRDPASYLKSYFLYRKYVQRWPPLRNLDIYQALEARLDHLLDNGMTRFFASTTPKPVEADDLQQAMANMQNGFVFVGMVERMEDTIARISALLRARLDVRTDNTTPSFAEAATIDPEELARRAEPFLLYDRDLYRYAEDLFW